MYVPNWKKKFDKDSGFKDMALLWLLFLDRLRMAKWKIGFNWTTKLNVFCNQLLNIFCCIIGLIVTQDCCQPNMNVHQIRSVMTYMKEEIINCHHQQQSLITNKYIINFVPSLTNTRQKLTIFHRLSSPKKILLNSKYIYIMYHLMFKSLPKLNIA